MLIVEDDVAMGSLLVRELSRRGFAMRHVTSANDALALIETEAFDAVGALDKLAWERNAVEAEAVFDMAYGALARHWPFWRRADQTPPDGDWRCWLLLAALPLARAQCAPVWAPADGLPGIDGQVLVTRMWDPDGAGPAGALLVVGGALLVYSSVSA